MTSACPFRRRWQPRTMSRDGQHRKIFQVSDLNYRSNSSELFYTSQSDRPSLLISLKRDGLTGILSVIQLVIYYRANFMCKANRCLQRFHLYDSAITALSCAVQQCNSSALAGCIWREKQLSQPGCENDCRLQPRWLQVGHSVGYIAEDSGCVGWGAEIHREMETVEFWLVEKREERVDVGTLRGVRFLQDCYD